MAKLMDFLQGNPDFRELKRALAVQMVMPNHTQAQIREILRVSVGFVTKWKPVFLSQGIFGLRLKHQESRGELNHMQKPTVIGWLNPKNYWHLDELKEQVEASYGVVDASNQSDYELFKQADISWKKTQKTIKKQFVVSSSLEQWCVCCASTPLSMTESIPTYCFQFS